MSNRMIDDMMYFIFFFLAFVIFHFSYIELQNNYSKVPYLKKGTTLLSSNRVIPFSVILNLIWIVVLIEFDLNPFKCDHYTYYTMINCIRICTRKYFSRLHVNLIPQSFSKLTYKSVKLYSAKKDKEGEDTVITFTQEEFDRIKSILSNQNGQVEEGDASKQEDFFQGEQAKLSLKLLQIDAIQQLKPLVIQYSNKPIQSQAKDKLQQTLRCKFLVLYKYVNLQGSLLSSSIQQLYHDIINNLLYLDETYLTIFFRMIAGDNKTKQSFRAISKKVVLIDHPSHSNSELMSLLLLLYPDQKDEIFKHYYLSFKRREASYREGIVEPQKDIVYDPINLVHILSHYYYYDDVHKLLEHTMRVKSIEEIDCFLEEFIQTEQDFSRRKIEAIVFAISHNLDAVYAKYLTKEFFNFEKMKVEEAVSLLKAIAFAEKVPSQNIILLKECSQLLINNLLHKNDSLILDEESQLQQNTTYKHIGEVLTSFLRKKQQFLPKQSIILLMRSIFESNSSWRIKFQLYPSGDLFTLIVCYKASKDYLKAQNQPQLDLENILFAKMLSSFSENLNNSQDIDQKQVFYVSLFAHQLNSLPCLRNPVVLQELRSFEKKKGLSSVVHQNLRQIISHLETLQ